MTGDVVGDIFMLLIAAELLFVVFLWFTGKGDLATLMVGRLALLDWAISFLYIGYLLVVGQGAVAMNALEAGRMSEVAMQTIFITLVTIGTVIAALLFFFVGVLRE